MRVEGFGLSVWGIDLGEERTASGDANGDGPTKKADAAATTTAPPSAPRLLTSPSRATRVESASPSAPSHPTAFATSDGDADDDDNDARRRFRREADWRRGAGLSAGARTAMVAAWAATAWLIVPYFTLRVRARFIKWKLRGAVSVNSSKTLGETTLTRHILFSAGVPTLRTLQYLPPRRCIIASRVRPLLGQCVCGSDGRWTAASRPD